MNPQPASPNHIKQQYDRDGYAIFKDVVDANLVHEASDHIDWLLARHPELRPEQLWHTLVPGDPFWVRLISDDRLLDIAEMFVGPNIALFASHYLCKPAFEGMPVLWHQDGSYWPLDPMEVVTLWLAIDDSLPENGCMRVIPGSQTTELQKMQKNTEVANVLNSEIDHALVDESVGQQELEHELRRRGIAVEEIRPLVPTLEDAFVELSRRRQMQMEAA